MKSLKSMLPLLIGMFVLLAVFQYKVPNFLGAGNLIDLAQQISVNAIIAFGMTLTILIGGIDLSVGAVLALVGTTTVFLIARGGQHQSTPMLLGAVAAGLAVAALVGLFNGLCSARTRIPPFIVTLATMQVARGAALRYNEGQPMSVPASQSLFLQLGNGRVFGLIPVPVIIMLVVFILMAIVLHQTLFGRRLYAIGGNSESARLSGVPMVRSIIIVYVICALLAGLAGLINASQLYSAEPNSGQGYELNAIAAVVVGGTSFSGGIGSMHGTLLGAIIIGILDKGLNQVGVHYSLQYVIKGLVILGAVYFDMRRRKN